MGFTRTLIVAFATVLGASSAQAHHELGAAFLDEEVTVEGTVVEYNFKNPHANIILSVAGGSGAETLWMATAPAPSSLRRGRIGSAYRWLRRAFWRSVTGTGC